MLRQRYQGVKNEKGVWITPAFPKLIYVLEEDNIHRGRALLLPHQACCQVHGQAHGARLHLREEDARVQALQGREAEGEGDVYTCMGCRSFLTPDRSGNGYDNVAKAGTTSRASRSTTAASTRAS
jgi:ribonucleoside-triphosphate reductase